MRFQDHVVWSWDTAQDLVSGNPINELHGFSRYSQLTRDGFKPPVPGVMDMSWFVQVFQTPIRETWFGVRYKVLHRA